MKFVLETFWDKKNIIIRSRMETINVDRYLYAIHNKLKIKGKLEGSKIRTFEKITGTEKSLLFYSFGIKKIFSDSLLINY